MTNFERNVFLYVIDRMITIEKNVYMLSYHGYVDRVGQAVSLTKFRLAVDLKIDVNK